MPALGERAHRSGRDGIDADALRPEVDREVAYRRFERGLGDAHDVVVGHDAGRAAERQRHNGAAGRHHGGGALGHFGEREAGDHHGAHEIVAAGVGVAALELVLVGERDRMHQKIQRAPLTPDLAEQRVDRGQVFHVARHDQFGASRLRQRAHAPPERLALIREGERRAFRGECLGNAPGDRVVIGHAHDQPALAVHQSHTLNSKSMLVFCLAPGDGRSFMCRAAGTRPTHWCRRTRTSSTTRSRVSRCRGARARSACRRRPDRDFRYWRSRR